MVYFRCSRLSGANDTNTNVVAPTRVSPQVNNHFTVTTAGAGGSPLIISGAGGRADPSSPYLVYIITEGEAREGAAGRGLRAPQATRAASVHQSARGGGVSGSVVHLPVRALPSSVYFYCYFLPASQFLFYGAIRTFFIFFILCFGRRET